MILTVPEELTAVSNGSLFSETSLDGNLKKFHWKSSYPITTYLVSIAISKYDKWTETFYNKDSSKSMPVEYYSFPNYTEKAKIDWGVTLDMLDFYSEIFGEYPFINEKYGMAMFGWVGGAMEHQTVSSMGYTLTTGDRRYEIHLLPVTEDMNTLLLMKLFINGMEMQYHRQPGKIYGSMKGLLLMEKHFGKNT